MNFILKGPPGTSLKAEASKPSPSTPRIRVGKSPVHSHTAQDGTGDSFPGLWIQILAFPQPHPQKRSPDLQGAVGGKTSCAPSLEGTHRMKLKNETKRIEASSKTE